MAFFVILVSKQTYYWMSTVIRWENDLIVNRDLKMPVGQGNFVL
jgi:hypothetical protein